MVVDPMRSSATTNYRLVRISEGLNQRYIELGVREYITPTQGNSDWERHSGSRGVNDSSTRTRAYSLTDPISAEEAYASYIPKVTGHALKRFSGPRNGLLHQTYRVACQVCQDPATPVESAELLSIAFRLWTSVRLLTMPAFIVGMKTPDLACDIQEVFTGMDSVPPNLGEQLKLTLLHYIERSLKNELIRRLQSLMYKDRKGMWLVIYLVTFMLLHSTTLLMGHGADDTIGPGLKVSFGLTRPSSGRPIQ